MLRTVWLRGRPLVRGGIVCLALVIAASTVSSVATREPQLRLIACFSHVGGLEAGDDVTLNGVVVGTVDELRLDREQRPCTELSVRADLELDPDTSASILTKNVLGEKYVAIDPGGADGRLASGDEIHYTQSALPLEHILMRMIERELGASFD